MFHHFLLLIFTLGFTFAGLSQPKGKPNPKADSLNRLIEKANDTTKVNLLNELCRIYAKNDMKKALQYAEQSLKLSKQNNYDKGEAQSLTTLGVLKRQIGDAETAFEYHMKALKIREKINDKKGMSISLINLSTIYQQKSNFTAAMEVLQQSLKIREELKDEKGILATLNNLGTMYMRQADEKSHDKSIYYKAKEYFEKALKLAHKLGDKQNEAILLNNIGSIYESTNEYQKSIENYLKAMKIREAIHDDFQLTSSYHSLGDVYLAMDSIKIATDYYEKGIIFGEKSQNKLVTGQCIYGLAKIYEKQKDYKTCLLKADESLKIAEKVQDNKLVINVKSLLAKVYAVKGDFAKAYRFKEEATTLKDSLFNAENSKILANAEANVEKERKEKLEKEAEIKAKDQKVKDARQALFNYLGLAIIVFIAGVAFLLFRGQQREKKHSKEIALEKDKSEALLLNILPEEVADELKAQGKAKARHYKMASVLFTDFQGFTARTASMTPEQVIEELNGCFSAFDAIIDKHGLEKIKTIGDAYMCAGGLPVPNTTNPVDIIRAGLEIQAYMQKYKEECIARGEAYFQCRLGINTGEVVAGVVGTRKFAYDIWGDTVNTASRAESSGVVNMVNITEATYLLVKDMFECEYRGEIEAKGKGKIAMYLVLREKTA